MSVVNEIPKVVAWLQEQVARARCNGLVLGISGGIDSSVAAMLVKKACPDTSLGIIIPIASRPQDGEDAKMVAEAIDLTHYEIDLTSEHRSILQTSLARLARTNDVVVQVRITDANLRARLRMAAIYTAANALNYLVVGTDNAAELYTGYFTKYGDGGCDILPLAAFTKSEVRALGRALNVPDQIMTKPPSAGLWEGQTDEGELETTYECIDKYLMGEPIPERDKQLIETLHRRSAHKRELPPYYRR